MREDYQSYVRRASNGGGYKSTRANDLTARLRAAIIRGELTAGQKINLDQLRNTYGVSLSPLREAISRLAVDGLVHVQDQRGARIASFTQEELEEIGRVRREIDVIALRESIQRDDPEWRIKLRDAAIALHVVSCAPTAPDLEERWAVSHMAFHHAMISGCGMPMFIDFCENFQDLQERYHRQMPCEIDKLATTWFRLASIAHHALEGSTEAAIEELILFHDSSIVALAESLRQST